MDVKELIFQKPWASNLLSEMQKLTEEKVLAWCYIITRIGEDDLDLDGYISIFKNNMTGWYSELILDMDSIQQKVLAKIEDDMEQLQHLCVVLSLKMPTFNNFSELPLSQLKQAVGKKLEEYEKLAASRKFEVDTLNEMGDKLAVALGMSIKQLSLCPLPTAEEVNNFKMFLDDLECEKMNREGRYFELQEGITGIVHELQLEPSLNFERDILNSTLSTMCVTDHAMDQMEKYYARLQKEQESVRAEISELRQKIHDIWERLEVDLLERNSFVKKHCGNSLKTLEALKEELRKCEELKQKNMKIFVDKQRCELKKLWDDCHCSQETRDEFSFFNCDWYTEDLFELHECEIQKLKHYYNKNQEIFKALQEHERLWQQMLSLDSKSLESGVNRYKNRGGQLLVEEKLRNKLAKQIPRLEDTLRQLSKSYYLRHGREFKTFGRTLDQYLDDLHKRHDTEMKNKLSAKKILREQNLTVKRASRNNLFTSTSKYTPVKRSMPSTPRSEQTRKLKTSVLKKKSQTTALPKLNVSLSKRISKIHEERRRRLSKNSTRNSNETSNNKTQSISYLEFEKHISLRSTGYAPEEKENKKPQLLTVPENIFKTPIQKHFQNGTTPRARQRVELQPIPR